MRGSRLLPILALFLMAAAGGCHRAPVSELKILVWASPEQKAILDRQIAEFCREQKSVRVHLQAVSHPEECREELENLARQGALPDVFLIESSFMPHWAGMGILRDLRPNHPDEKILVTETVESLSMGDRLYAMPCGWSSLVLYYNRGLLERQGVPMPRASWDWGDLWMAAQSLTVVDEKASPPHQYGLEASPSPSVWLPFLWQNNGRLMNDEGLWMLTDPQFMQSNRQSLEFYADLVREHAVAAPSTSHKASRPGRLFLAQKAAMVFAQRELADELAQHREIDWDIQILPHAAQNASLLEVYGFAISSKSPHPDLAWQLVAFLTRDTAEAAMIQRGIFAPARRNLLDSKLFLDFPGTAPAYNLALLKSLPFSQKTPRTDTWPSAERILTEEMSALMLDPKMKVRPAMDRMQARLDELNLLSHRLVQKPPP